MQQDMALLPELELLKNLTGYAEPGVLTALMGGSGAGKTTLMVGGGDQERERDS